MDTNNYIDVIETVITSLKQEGSGMVTHNQDGYLWKFQYGTVEVFVQISGLTDDDTFTVWSMVLKPPFKNEVGLYRKILEMNSAETLEARFAILGEEVAVLSTRSTADLSPSEISSAITTVATLADYYDEPLQEEFGA
ncbi:MAG: YbjN domain-containing protein [Prochlorotrichaceae cyanobacterium]